ncbi:AAA family ATPase, partial [Xanthomonas citri pv. citri]|nr:AAA family ATPase [Xanthomonas citri pv. citri]
EYAAGINDNKLTGAVFLVDEASMIGDGGMDRNLLEDLIHYVYGGIGCRMVFIGDTAQLPPVGADESPAMQPEVLRGYGLKVTRA